MLKSNLVVMRVNFNCYKHNKSSSKTVKWFPKFQCHVRIKIIVVLPVVFSRLQNIKSLDFTVKISQNKLHGSR